MKVKNDHTDKERENTVSIYIWIKNVLTKVLILVKTSKYKAPVAALSHKIHICTFWNIILCFYYGLYLKKANNRLILMEQFLPPFCHFE
jgi:hypothetical protein